MPFYDNLDCIDYLYEKLDTNKATLGIRYVGYADEDFLPQYPAVVFASGLLAREIHSTQGFRNEVTVEIFVLHAALSLSHRARTRADLAMVREITDLIHLDMTLDGNIVHGYITSEIPGEIVDEKGESVVGTRMVWYGQLREPFRRS